MGQWVISGRRFKNKFGRFASLLNCVLLANVQNNAPMGKTRTKTIEELIEVLEYLTALTSSKHIVEKMLFKQFQPLVDESSITKNVHRNNRNN